MDKWKWYNVTTVIEVTNKRAAVRERYGTSRGRGRTAGRSSPRFPSRSDSRVTYLLVYRASKHKRLRQHDVVAHLLTGPGCISAHDRRSYPGGVSAAGQEVFRLLFRFYRRSRNSGRRDTGVIRAVIRAAHAIRVRTRPEAVARARAHMGCRPTTHGGVRARAHLRCK